MKTFIVPVDFSDTSRNAALYAVQIAASLQETKIILYNVFEKSSQEGVAAGSVQVPANVSVQLAMNSIRREMLTISPEVDIQCVAEESDSLIDSLERFTIDEDADLLIMGITESGRIDQSISGSHTLSMVHKNVCPVIIVPPHASFTGIRNVMLATDYKDVENTIPADTIRKVLDIFKSDVHVVNVDSEHYVELSDDYKRERAKLENILDGYSTAYYYIRQYDFVDAIGQFATDKNIDMILTIPKKHSLFSKLFVTSHTKKLAYNSEVPVLAIHED